MRDRDRFDIGQQSRLKGSWRPDVLLLDVHLGTDDWLAIGTGLRQEGQYGSLKIVFMSGTAERREIIRLSELWNVQTLLKPFELDALLDAVG